MFLLLLESTTILHIQLILGLTSQSASLDFCFEYKLWYKFGIDFWIYVLRRRSDLLDYK